MAVAVEPRKRQAAHSFAAAVGNLTAVRALTALVAVSFAVRALVGLFRATPVYFGDEYLYSSISKSIAETGRPLVRSGSAHFPALLGPILTAPAWLFGNVSVSYHLAQAIGALAMSLAAIPAYALARRLGLGSWTAVGVAALALVLPDLIYATWMVAEPFAYPLALAAVVAAVAALEKPTKRAQLGFLALAGLATFARVQFVVLPACFLGALVIAGLRERRLRSALREQVLVLALLALPVGATAILGLSRVLAFYKGVVHVQVDPGTLVESSGRNLLVLLFSSGAVIVPGAILGLVFAIGRPRSRGEIAFGAMTVLLTVALLVEAGLFGAVDQAQERYVFYLVPLFAVSFGLYGSRGWPHRLYHALLAAGLVALAAVVPLAGYAAADEKAHAPLLFGVFRVEKWLGSPGNGSLAVALAVTVGLAAVVAASARPRVATALGFSIAVALSAGLGVAAVTFDQEDSHTVRRAQLPADPSWVDHAKLGDVTLLRNIAGIRGGAYQQLFWNRSVKRLALMPGAAEIDSYSADRVRVTGDGALLAAGRPLTGPLLVDEHAVTTRFSGVTKVASGPGYSLYRPNGAPRLALFFLARFEDGWLADRGTINLWPSSGSHGLRGTLVFDVSSPPQLGPATLGLQLPGGRQVHVRVADGGTTRVQIPVCSRGTWETGFHSKIRAFVGGHAGSVQSSVPRLVPGAVRCGSAPVQTPSAAAAPPVTA